jgi:FKBP-type peptidyl-prolyl cis-trans isomerase SlyD
MVSRGTSSFRVPAGRGVLKYGSDAVVWYQALTHANLQKTKKPGCGAVDRSEAFFKRIPMTDLYLVAKDAVVSFHYTLKNSTGDVLDSSEGREPLAYLHGYGQIVPGLENALVGKAAGGDPFVVVVQPEEGYGVRHDELVINVPKEQWTLPDSVGVNEVIELQSDNGEQTLARIVAISSEAVTLDANHPLAGEALHFQIQLTEVRAATQEELSHGHAHGPGGHQH